MTILSLIETFKRNPADSRQLLVDVSELTKHDAQTGIQRVVRNILHEILQTPPVGYQVLPVYVASDHQYYYAYEFLRDFLDAEKGAFPKDHPIKYSAGDYFIGLDFTPKIRKKTIKQLTKMKRSSVKIWFVVYDLLSIQLPDYFPSFVSKTFHDWLLTISKFEGAVCISDAVRIDLYNWYRVNNHNVLRTFSIKKFDLGTDFKTLPTNVEGPVSHCIHHLSQRSYILVVGTIEPRKGHREVLRAFDILWSRGFDFQLVFVGKEGWMVEDLLDSISHHPLLNTKLHLFKGIDDVQLAKLYENAKGLIMASKGEGFGLPIIEAQGLGCPLLVRDIPVFREVAGEHAHYFLKDDPESLAESISDWVRQDGGALAGLAKAHIKRKNTWSESAKSLLNAVLN